MLHLLPKLILIGELQHNPPPPHRKGDFFADTRKSWKNGQKLPKTCWKNGQNLPKICWKNGQWFL